MFSLIFVEILGVICAALLSSSYSLLRSQNSTSFSDKSDLSSHSLVFISGWPQSGTSLLQQMFTMSPYISTMQKGCNEKINPKDCLRWNHEGQWMLKAPSPLLSGVMCPINSTPSSNTSETIISQWKQFWNLKNPILMEKSPQSMLKIPFYRDIFKHVKSIKFLIIIKHPVTLNTATQRHSSWKHLIKANLKRNGPGKEASVSFENERLLNREEIEANANFFADFMLHDHPQSRSNPCSKGIQFSV